MADATVYGIDINALMAVAGAQAQGSQKARFCSDIATILGSNAIFRIKVGGTTKYQSTVVGALTSSASGIAMPTQFVEPASTNVADALTASDALIEVSNASNQTIRITVPLKSSVNAAFLLASAVLDGTKLVRTSGVLLTPPTSLDASVGSGSTTGIYLVSTLNADMANGNTNGWYIEAAPNTQDLNGPGGKYPYIAIGRNRSDAQSYWPGEYLSDSSPQGVGISDGTSIRRQPWFVVGRAAQVAGTAGNTRVQTRGFKQLVLESGNTWTTDASTDEAIESASWHANFRSPGNETYEAITTGGQAGQRRVEPSGNGGGSSLGSIGVGNDGSAIPRRLKWALHGYPVNSSRTRLQWLQCHGAMTVLEARLILHDPSGTDDRANAGLLMWTGADWYAGGSYINEHCHGRLKLITNDWQIFSAHDLTSAQLASYPPTGYS